MSTLAESILAVLDVFDPIKVRNAQRQRYQKEQAYQDLLLVNVFIKTRQAVERAQNMGFNPEMEQRLVQSHIEQMRASLKNDSRYNDFIGIQVDDTHIGTPNGIREITSDTEPFFSIDQINKLADSLGIIRRQ